jgi:holo-[acyl-carrier protein] synthase
MQRLFHADEIAYATEAPALTAQRLAARFAAKEAAITALRRPAQGVGLRNIEVRRDSDGDCSIQLHGAARTVAADAGMTVTSISLTHEGDYAAAVVLVQCSSPSSPCH